LNLIPFSTFVPSFLFKIISNICLRKKGGTSKKTKKGRIHHGIKIPCFLRQLINKTVWTYGLFDRNKGKTIAFQIS
ncbi:hypothetical protein, partial [Lactobacillus helveticus]|uniref:hypothetical protein n=1 Tax=Lactobacillus helveticus TaxID=1587 RepID=UPI001C647E25